MNTTATIYITDEDGEEGEIMVETPGDNVGIHLQIDGKIVASAFLDSFQLGVLVGQLSVARVKEGAAA